jgi:hypothetical protein
MADQLWFSIKMRNTVGAEFGPPLLEALDALLAFEPLDVLEALAVLAVPEVLDPLEPLLIPPPPAMPLVLAPELVLLV